MHLNYIYYFNIADEKKSQRSSKAAEMQSLWESSAGFRGEGSMQVPLPRGLPQKNGFQHFEIHSKSSKNLIL